MLPEEKRITCKQHLKEWLDYELRHYPKGIWAHLPSESAVLRTHQILLRKTEYYTNLGNRIMALLYKFRLRVIQNKHSLLIPINACGKGLHIMHLGPVLMNGDVTVGENCSIHINTALVAGGTSNEVPTLGDGVVVGVGAVVLGGVYVANYTAIGANAVVNKDITEENIAVAGVPAKKVSNNGSKEWNKQ